MNLAHTVRLILLGGIMLLPVAADAEDEKSIYESLPDVTIGRVFFSPEQRARLDKQRQGIFVVAATRSSAPATRAKTSDKAAGYISSSNGPTRVYSDGDFVTTRDSQSLVFPGTVRVVRGAAANDDEAGDEDK
ncbi:MAG: hypothetical protein K0U72_14340 [Gammaproteobacteria bacterium]|nr:hypothetical protein [Gammaproteobacteria bacterium]